MVIYVEAVLFDNFCLDFLLAYATLFLRKQKAGIFPIILSATVGSLFALLYPLCTDFGIPFKIGVLLISAALFTGKKPWRTYLGNTFLYLFLSFALSGLISFLLGENMKNGLIGVRFGGAIGHISLASIFFLWSMRQIGGMIREGKRKGKFATAELINADKRVRMRALFDSGNLLTDANGEGVVVTDRRRAEVLGKLSVFGEMTVHTASGSKVLELVKIPEIKIYYEDSENILTNVTAALSDLPDEYALILPCE